MTTKNTPNITMDYGIHVETGKGMVYTSCPYAESDFGKRERKKIEKVEKAYRKFMNAVNDGRSTIIEGHLEITLKDTGRRKENPKDVWAIPPAGC